MLTELRRCFFLGRERAGFSLRLGELTAALAWSCGMETPSLLDYWYLPPSVFPFVVLVYLSLCL